MMPGPGPLTVLEYTSPAPADVRAGVATGGGVGLLDLPSESHVLSGIAFDNATQHGALVMERIPLDVELHLPAPLIFEVEP